jgi:hypothetical protein
MEVETMCKKINLTIDQIKALDMESLICTSIKLMKYLTEVSSIRYTSMGISSDGWTFFKFKEGKELKEALKNYKFYSK